MDPALESIFAGHHSNIWNQRQAGSTFPSLSIQSQVQGAVAAAQAQRSNPLLHQDFETARKELFLLWNQGRINREQFQQGVRRLNVLKAIKDASRYVAVSKVCGNSVKFISGRQIQTWR